jgi:hypothetical protein
MTKPVAAMVQGTRRTLEGYSLRQIRDGGGQARHLEARR